MAHFALPGARPMVPPLQLAGLLADGAEDGPAMPPAYSDEASVQSSGRYSSDAGSDTSGREGAADALEYYDRPYHEDGSCAESGNGLPDVAEEDEAFLYDDGDQEAFLYDNDQSEEAFLYDDDQRHMPFTNDHAPPLLPDTYQSPSAAPSTEPLASPPHSPGLAHPLTAALSTATSPLQGPLDHAVGSLPAEEHGLPHGAVRAQSSGVESWASALDTLRSSIQKLAACPSLHNSPRALTHRYEDA